MIIFYINLHKFKLEVGLKDSLIINHLYFYIYKILKKIF